MAPIQTVYQGTKSSVVNATVSKLEGFTGTEKKTMTVTGMKALAGTFQPHSFPRRPAFGSNGKDVTLFSNFFPIELVKPNTPIFLYTMVPKLEMNAVNKPRKGKETGEEVRHEDDYDELDNIPARKLRNIVEKALRKLGARLQGKIQVSVATEYKSKLVTTGKLPSADLENILIDLEARSGQSSGEQWRVSFTGPKEIRLANVQKYLNNVFASDHSEKDDSIFPKFPEELDALGIIINYQSRKNPLVASLGPSRFFEFGKKQAGTDEFRKNQQEQKSMYLLLRGFFSSPRPATGRLLLNVNVTHGVFRNPILLSEAIGEWTKDKVGAAQNLKELSILLKGARVKYRTNPKNPEAPEVERVVSGLAHWEDGIKDGKHRIKIDEAVEENSSSQYGKPKNTSFAKGKFVSEKDNDWVTVSDHFYDRYRWTPNKALPLLNLGTKTKPEYVPAECCTVIPGQPIRTKLSGDVLNDMITFACRLPHQVADTIGENKGNLLPACDEPAPNARTGAQVQTQHLLEFGVKVQDSMIQVIGRQLNAPTVMYRSNEKVKSLWCSSWNVKERNKKETMKMVTSGNTSTMWTWVHIKPLDKVQYTDDEVLPAIKALVEKATAMGVNIRSFEGVGKPAQRGRSISVNKISSELEEFLTLAKRDGKCGLVFIILPRKDTALYSTIKNIADVDVGIHTVCIDSGKICNDKIIEDKKATQKQKQKQMMKRPKDEKDLKNIDDTMSNIALKINLKSGPSAVNHTLETGTSRCSKFLRNVKKSTMFVGYDVTHPTGVVKKKPTEAPKKKPTETSKVKDLEDAAAKLTLSPQTKNTKLKPSQVSKDKPEQPPAPSIVGLVASVDCHASAFPGSIWKNRKDPNAGKEAKAAQEMVDEGLAQHFKDCLHRWTEASDASKGQSTRLPDNIVIFRDGVSEGQFQQVLDKELPHFRTACNEKYAGKTPPKITLVVSVKRHHTRFFPTKTADAECGSPKAGTVVDRGVTNMRYWDFYLQSHTAIKGTARPAHYTVLHDEVFKDEVHPANELEKLTNELCYLFGRATKAIGIAPPARYADLLCDRARIHNHTHFAGPDVHRLPFRTVHKDLKDTMYYI